MERVISWDLHIGWLVLGGIALLAMTVLPRALHRRPLSVPLLYVIAGFAVFEFSDSLAGPRPLGVGFDHGEPLVRRNQGRLSGRVRQGCFAQAAGCFECPGHLLTSGGHRLLEY